MEKKLQFKSFKEELKDINEFEGEERALDLEYVTQYVKNKEGEGKYNLLLKKLNEIGFTLPESEKTEKMNWIPVKIPIFFIIASAKFFNWSRQDILDMGQNFIVFSPLLKIFMKYFASPQKMLKSSMNIWRKHYTLGDLEVIDFNEKENKLFFRLKNFQAHPIYYTLLVGSLEKLIEIALGFKNVKGKEEPCQFKKKNCYEFIFNWD